MRVGIPVLESNLPEIARVMRDQDVDEVADPDDVQSIVAGISQLLSVPNRYTPMQESAHRAAAVFNWEIEKEKLLSLYEELS